MTEWSVITCRDCNIPFVANATTDIFDGNTLREQVFEQHNVGSLRIHIVRADQIELLVTFSEQVIHCRYRLLANCFSGVDDIRRLFFTLILNRVEEQAIILLVYRQCELTAHRSPATKGRGNLIFSQQLLGFFREDWPVRCAVRNDRFDLLAEHAAIGIDLVESKK